LANTPYRYGNSHARPYMGSHSFTGYPAVVTFPHPAFTLANFTPSGTRFSDPEECKAELTKLAWLHRPTEVVYPPEDGHPSQYTNWAQCRATSFMQRTTLLGQATFLEFMLCFLPSYVVRLRKLAIVKVTEIIVIHNPPEERKNSINKNVEKYLFIGAFTTRRAKKTTSAYWSE